jgi:hypothetical protein
MKPIAYVLAAILGLFGIVEILAAPRGNTVVMFVVGSVCLAAGAALVVLVRLRPAQHTHVHKMELDVTGNVSLEKMACRQCGAEVSSDSVNVAAGAVFVKCEYCGAQYQIEEDVKW